MSSHTHHLGIDLGGTCIKAVRVTRAGDRIEDANLPFEDRNREWAGRIRDFVQNSTRAHGPLASIGLSAPGLAATGGGHIAFMPGRLMGLEGLDWTAFLHSPKPVPVLNDAHAALLGEVWQGAARGCRNVFLLTLGTGVGGAALVDGRLLKGHLGRAGHLGHVSLNFEGPLDDVGTPGSLESEIGNKTLRERTGGRFPDTHTLVAAHRKGDADATRIWRRSVRALAVGIASLVNVLDPEVVILAGGIARAGAVLFDPIREDLEKFEWRPGGARVRILPAQLGDLAGAYGSAWNGMQDKL
ncbi:MAG: ROK family protein [Pedosphaera sp.]|nr:ROK family protein [Pedosphaera sp.]